MQDRFSGLRRIGAAVPALSLLGLVAACDMTPPPAPVEEGRAPVAMGGLPSAAAPAYGPPPVVAAPPAAISRAPLAAPPMAEVSPPVINRPPAALPRSAAAAQTATRPRQGVQIVVRPGQSIGGLAAHYHISRRDIIAANDLKPPYDIEIGQHLLIPGAGRDAEMAAAAPPSEHRAAERAMPEIIPLDGPAVSARAAPARTDAAPEKIDLDTAAAAPAPAPPVRAETPPHSDGMLWPVQGRVVSGFGAAGGGRRNDGINIAAPLGAPVRAAGGGVVAYVGNEVRGYGNLVLIRHPDGYISAYAHCETLLVRKGERVARGQVIAKVGATGGAAQPQLHFELRRGEQAVDPRQFLSPSPAAAAAAPRAG